MNNRSRHITTDTQLRNLLYALRSTVYFSLVLFGARILATGIFYEKFELLSRIMPVLQAEDQGSWRKTYELLSELWDFGETSLGEILRYYLYLLSLPAVGMFAAGLGLTVWQSTREKLSPFAAILPAFVLIAIYMFTCGKEISGDWLNIFGWMLGQGKYRLAGLGIFMLACGHALFFFSPGALRLIRERL